MFYVFSWFWFIDQLTMVVEKCKLIGLYIRLFWAIRRCQRFKVCFFEIIFKWASTSSISFDGICVSLVFFWGGHKVCCSLSHLSKTYYKVCTFQLEMKCVERDATKSETLCATSSPTSYPLHNESKTSYIVPDFSKFYHCFFVLFFQLER